MPESLTAAEGWSLGLEGAGASQGDRNPPSYSTLLAQLAFVIQEFVGVTLCFHGALVIWFFHAKVHRLRSSGASEAALLTVRRCCRRGTTF